MAVHKNHQISGVIEIMVVIKELRCTDVFDVVTGVDLDAVELVILDAVTLGMSSVLLLFIKLNKLLPLHCDFASTKVLCAFPVVREIKAEHSNLFFFMLMVFLQRST